MTSCDLLDNHSLMKLYVHKLEIQGFQKMYGFPKYVDNEWVGQQFPEQKFSPANFQILFKPNDRRDYYETFLKDLVYYCGRLEVFLIIFIKIFQYFPPLGFHFWYRTYVWNQTAKRLDYYAVVSVYIFSLIIQ